MNRGDWLGIYWIAGVLVVVGLLLRHRLLPILASGLWELRGDPRALCRALLRVAVGCLLLLAVAALWPAGLCFLLITEIRLRAFRGRY